MASVKEELLQELEDEWSTSRELAERAVDRAIAEHADSDIFGSDIESTADYIYNKQSYWED